HSVLVDPRKPRHLLAGISSVGTFESKDGGRTWTTENRGVRAEFMPNKYPEWGQCVHKLAWDGSGDGSIFQQNHCGTYHRGPDGGAWTEVTKGLPSDFGFPIAADPNRKHTAFVTPLIGGENRVFPKGQMAVWKTANAGKSWRRETKGLPANAFMGVGRQQLRDAPHGRGPRFAVCGVGAEEQRQGDEEPSDADEERGRQGERSHSPGASDDRQHRTTDEAGQEGDETEDQEAQMLRGRP